MSSFSDGLSDDDNNTAEGEVEGEVDQYLLEISMVGCNGLKCHGNPLGGHCSVPEHDIPEPCRP